MTNPEELLLKFKQSFIKNLQCSDDSIFLNVLNPRVKNGSSIRFNRTAFYSQHLFSKIAEDLGLKVVPEFLRIDLSLCKDASYGYNSGEIYVEMENVLDDGITQEVSKLCSVYAPLKVLVTWTWEYWNEIRDGILNEDWSYVVNSYEENLGTLPGIFIVIIAETDHNEDSKRIKYYLSRWDSQAKMFGEDEVLFERQFSL